MTGVQTCALPISGLTALPALDASTDVWVVNCPGLTALPALDAATVVRVVNCPGLTKKEV